MYKIIVEGFTEFWYASEQEALTAVDEYSENGLYAEYVGFEEHTVPEDDGCEDMPF